MTRTITETTVAARVAGEDIACGDYVTVLNEIIEFPSFLWDHSVAVATDEPVRIRYRASDAGKPQRVIGICLPFVYVESPCGSVVTLDTRGRQLVRLAEECAGHVWNEMAIPKKKRRK